jgi:hypothetical protein
MSEAKYLETRTIIEYEQWRTWSGCSEVLPLSFLSCFLLVLLSPAATCCFAWGASRAESWAGWAVEETGVVIADLTEECVVVEGRRYGSEER